MSEHHSITFRITGFKEGATAKDKIKYFEGLKLTHRPTSEFVYYIMEEDQNADVQQRRDDFHTSMQCKICFPNRSDMIDERKAPGA